MFIEDINEYFHDLPECVFLIKHREPGTSDLRQAGGSTVTGPVSTGATADRLRSCDNPESLGLSMGLAMPKHLLGIAVHC